MLRKVLSIALTLLMVFSLFMVFQPDTAFAVGTTYYVSYSGGNDNNNGTSSSTPWKTLAKVGSRSYSPGDQILLKCGDEWNEQLTLSNSSGTASNYITLSSYGTGTKPKIRRNLSTTEVCVKINDASYIKVLGLDIGNAGMGLQFYYNNSYNHAGIWVEDCYFHDIYGIWQFAPSSAFPGAQFSAGILVGGTITSQQSSYVFVDGVTVKNCTSYYCGSLMCSQNDVKIANAPWPYKKNVNIDGCTMTYNTIYGNVVSETEGGTMSNCTLLHNGSMPIQVGSTALMIGNLRNYTITNCEFGYQQRQGSDPDGCGIDFEVSCSYVTMNNNHIHHNAGVGIMFFNNGGNIHDHCAVTSNTFEMNNQNIGNIGGYEIYFAQSNANQYGSVTGNTYYQMAGIGFVNGYDANLTTVSNNTMIPDSGTGSNGWEFTSGQEGWTATNQIANLSAVSGYLNGTVTGPDPYMHSASNLGIDISTNKSIEIAMKNSSSGTTAQVYFVTNSDQNWDEAKSKSFSIQANDSGYTVYTIDMSSVPGWTGILNRLRLDPNTNVSSGTFSIDYIRIQESPVVPPAGAYNALADFSTTQGQGYRNWYYKEWNGSSYMDMTADSASNRWNGSPGCIIGDSWQHPGPGGDSARTWVAPSSGTLRIYGNARKASGTTGGNGVIAAIYQNTAQIWQKTIAAADTTGYDFDITRTVSAGDSIYFRLNSNGNNQYDTTEWSPTIEYTGNIPVTGVTLSKTSMNLQTGGSERLTATVAPADASNPAVTWNSSNNSVATVDQSGLVTGIAAGNAVITVTTVDGGKTASCNVVVQAQTTVTYRASTDFSTTQGQGYRNWYYKEWNGSSYVNLTADSANSWWFGSPGSFIYDAAQHPGPSADSARTWIAPSQGTLRIYGNARKDPGSIGGNGVIASIYKNGTQVWQRTIAAADTTGYDFDLTCTVNIGDAIYFVLNSIGGDNRYDKTLWDPTIEFSAAP